MVTPAKKRSSNKFCDFHNDKGHSTDECMQLKKQIKELVRAGKLSHLKKEIKQGRDQTKNGKKEASAKDKSLAIYMIQPWQRMTSDGTEGPLVIEAEIGGHMIHRMYIDGGSSTEVTIAIQRYHWKTWNTGNPSSTIYGSWDAKVPHQREDIDVAIGGTLSTEGRTKLCSLLKKNLDIFTWQPSDMTGVPRSVAEHRLNIREGYSPVRQKKRGQAPERSKAIQAELENVRRFHGLKQGLLVGFYPLPEIDWKVESLCGYPFKIFLDAYKGYHQIQMAESDEEKMAFHTSQGVYCYTKMPFGLKNDGATYQRLVDKAFDSQVGRNMKVYVDDLVIKSHTKEEMIRDIIETFRTLRRINMKLNPKKCTFGAREGMFLGFLSKSAEKSLPLFKTLKKCIKKSDFHWTPEAKQGPSRAKARLGPELNYSPMEKLVLSLVFTAKRLRRYFQAHPIAVITDQPIKQIMSRPDVAGRLQKWSVMLGEHTSVKGQILADFLIEKLDENLPETPAMDILQEP
ncbi:reverse transcriptase domain-containing protein [Tanacetum coccineum]|uniref:Reverse transcriptase domain-containing protein n=1 Tax=Tanacetum coccineum TaxID=301880 RepID=A0ABQ5HMJ1_9ASTR